MTFQSPAGEYEYNKAVYGELSPEAQASLQRMLAAALQIPAVQVAAETEAQKVFIDKYAVPVVVGAAALLGLAFWAGQRKGAR